MNSTVKLVHVVGARPNFMKVAPLLRVLDQDPGFDNVLVHTGQHYDAPLSDMVLRDLGVRTPDYNLGVGSSSHARQTAAVMVGMEEVFDEVETRILSSLLRFEALTARDVMTPRTPTHKKDDQKGKHHA